MFTTKYRKPVLVGLDVRVDRTYQWGSRRVTLFAEVANLLDRQNVRQVPPFIDFQSRQAFEPFKKMFPLLPSIGAALEF